MQRTAQSEAMRLENERVKRQNEARLQRKRTGAAAGKEGGEARSAPKGKGGSSGSTSGGIIAVVLLLLLGGFFMLKGGSKNEVVSDVVEVTETPAPVERAAPVLAEAAPVEATTEEGDSGADEMAEPAAVSEVAAEPVEVVVESPPPEETSPPPPPQSFSRWQALTIPETCLRPGVSPSGIIPGLELHDREGVTAHYLEPEGTTEATETQVKQTSEQKEEHKAAQEELQDAKEDLKEAVEELKDEIQEEKEIKTELQEEKKELKEEAAAEGETVAEESAPAESTPAADEAAPASEEAAPASEEASPASEEAAPASEEAAPASEEASPASEEAAPASEEASPASEESAPAAEESAPADDAEAARRRRHRRSLLGRKGGNINIQKAAPVPTPVMMRQRDPGPQVNPLLLDGMEAGAELAPDLSTEKKVMHHLANVTLFDIACQFTTAECADAAALQLAAALRADAEAVVNPDVTPEELKRVSQGLASLHSNSRTMLNASALPAMGKAGSLGSCALSSDAEYDPDGFRYDATVSRFATVIDLHDTLVYCAPKAHYCKFTKLTPPVSEVTVRLDAQSYLLAKGAGAKIHEALASDEGLGGGIANWGHAGDPTHQFITTIMLLRSGLCSRLDIYGQPSIPLEWYRAQGYGHITAVPGKSEKDKLLAKTLVQERFFYRVVMHENKLCFFK